MVGTCGVKVKSTQRGLKCDSCDYWYHLSCEKVKISTEQYKQIGDLPEVVQWLCNGCKQVRGNCDKELILLRRENADLKEENKNLRERIDKIDREIEILKKTMLESVNSNETLVEYDVNKIKTEIVSIMNEKIQIEVREHLRDELGEAIRECRSITAENRKIVPSLVPSWIVC